MDLDNLIIGFNEMADKLDNYEKEYIQKLILEKLKFETLISSITDGAILLDRELRIIFFNYAVSKEFKFFKNCIIGAYIFNYLPHYLNSQLIPVLNKMIHEYNVNNVDLYSRQIFIAFDNKASKTLRFILTTVFDQKNNIVIGVAIIIQDITKEVEISEAKGQFISNVSHELRTPLFNIESFLETLLDYNNSLTEHQKIEFLNIAIRETQRLTCLVNDILDLSRLESDLQYSIDCIELETVMVSVIQSFKIRAYNQKIKLVFQFYPNILNIKGSYNLLIQVLSNLIGNAIKFTQSDGRVVLRLYLVTVMSKNHKSRQKYHKIRVEIIDEGKGISRFDQSRIFDRFVRVENNIHTLDGTGLGLSIVKNIVERHDSQIYLYSEIEVGSSFWFDLLLCR